MSTIVKDEQVSQDEVDRLIEQFDPEANFRRVLGFGGILITIVSFLLSAWHVYTAGFGLENEILHRAIHLSVVLGLSFLVFPNEAKGSAVKLWGESLFFMAFYLLMTYQLMTSYASQLGNGTIIFYYGLVVLISLLSLPLKTLDGVSKDKIPLRDWFFAALAGGFSLYLVVFFNEIFINRPGTHTPTDIMVGLIAIIMVCEVTRRTMGIILPLIAVVVVLYGVFGAYLPGDLAHRGYSVSRVVAHLYKGTEGIYGIPVGVVATFVFHFVLFGIMAQLSGLGQLFFNLSMVLAGRYSGGAAKVCVVSSGMFGMISGSAIANAVTTGVMTIPMMKRTGFSPRFAGGVEASASVGGQITPPIMGASAFIMAETLGVPYTYLALIAIVPAFMHYFAIVFMVHCESKRLNLQGMDKKYIPNLIDVFKRSWHLLVPLITMVSLLLNGFTPFLAAFWGIILCVVCSWIPRLPLFNKTPMEGLAITPAILVRGFEAGAKSALSIGAASACVGFILGIMTLTGMGFKFSNFVLTVANDVASFFDIFDIWNFWEITQLSVFFGLVFTAMACIIMGAGVPTTPTYIILASIVAPTLAQLGVPQIATHFFVFYYGVLADVTPPVALAAFAAAGIARTEPMRCGFTAFRLSMAKALVPFTFVYMPAILFINFTWFDFIHAITATIVSLLGLGAAYSGFFGSKIGWPAFILLNIAAITMIFGNIIVNIFSACIIIALLFYHQWVGRQKLAVA